MEFFLEHLSGERPGRVETFRDVDLIRVGRSAEYELAFDDLGVSFDHAELRIRDGAVWLVDRGSTNGSFLNSEKAHNSKLRDGDIVKFGKRGPELRFRLRKPSSIPASALQAVSKAAIPSAPMRMPASSPRHVAVAPAPPNPAHGLQVAEPVPLRRASAVQAASASASASAAKRPSAETSLIPKLVASVFFIASLATITFLIFQLVDSDERLGISNRALTDLQTQSRVDGESTRIAQLGLERKLSEERNLVASLRSEIEDINRKSKKDKDQSDSRIRELMAELKTREDRVRDLRKQIEVAEHKSEDAIGKDDASDRVIFQRIQKRFNRSVVLIFTQLKGKDKNGNIVNLSCTGTGFIVNSQGFIVTNKHVIQPWKFSDLATRIAVEGIEVDLSTHHVAVWIAGTRFRAKNTNDLDLSSGFSTQTGSLEINRVAQDEFVTLPLAEGQGPRAIKVHSPRSNNDVAILRATVGGPFTYIIPHGSSDLPIEKLDPVLVLGFPMGVSILEGDIAETAPTTGAVRKVDDSIWVSATMQPGSSGGPIFDRSGRVIGISTRIMKGFDSLGACIKIEHALKLLGGTW